MEQKTAPQGRSLADRLDNAENGDDGRSKEHLDIASEDWYLEEQNAAMLPERHSASQQRASLENFRQRANSSSSVHEALPDDARDLALQGPESLDLSFFELDTALMSERLESLAQNADRQVRKVLHLHGNRMNALPRSLTLFPHLQYLDVSHNHLVDLSQGLSQLENLKTLIARGNLLDDDSFPKSFASLRLLEVLNLSGNSLRTVPYVITELTGLKALYLGGNQIEELPHGISRLQRLEVLYLGGNRLTSIPEEVGHLQFLKALILCENQLESLPSSIACLHRLQSLALHKNHLTTLPPEIVTLRGLVELSLRDNPLVVRFVRDMMFNPPSLQELAARCIKICKVPYNEEDLPPSLTCYLGSAQRCVNPKCKGVYFDTCVEHIKFVDFCGKYRLPLLQYLCSPLCSTQPAVRYSISSESDGSDDDYEVPASKLKRVLLG